MDSYEIDEPINAYQECPFCGASFISGQNLCVIAWRRLDGEIGQQPAHTSCAEKHPMNIEAPEVIAPNLGHFNG